MTETAEKMTQVVIYMPPSKVRAVDATRGAMKRSAWILKAIEEKLDRERATTTYSRAKHEPEQ